MEALLSRWYKSLPVEESTYATSEVQIPMPDGVHLAADLYLPSPLQPDANFKPHGLILVLGCYGRGGIIAVFNALVFAKRGYTVLFVSCRGTFGSGGIFNPGVSEQGDSQTIVEWMREQTWYPGKFATFGASYLGYTQWALLHEPPEDLIASIVLCGPHDLAEHNWNNGAFRMDRISWSHMVAHQEDPVEPGVNRLTTAGQDLKSVLEALPVVDAAERHFDGKAQYLQKNMNVPNIDDPHWASVRHGPGLERVSTNMPILLGSGWYDTFTYQTMEQYERLKRRGCKVNITIGPWTHMEACGLHSMPEVFEFLDEHVASRKKNHRPLAVKAFVTGAEEWRQLPIWPPATEPRTFYFNDDKSLSINCPVVATPLTFTYHPNSPTPTIGGGLLTGGGRVDDSIYASRSDLLVYTSPSLTEEVEVMGKPVVQVTHTSNEPYVDLWVRLSEVDASGVSHNIVETYKALDERRESSEVSLVLQDCAHLFKKGTQIRVIVAGGSFPLMARNLGTEGNRTTTTEMKPVLHRIQHRNGISKLILPCSP